MQSSASNTVLNQARSDHTMWYLLQITVLPSLQEIHPKKHLSNSKNIPYYTKLPKGPFVHPLRSLDDHNTDSSPCKIDKSYEKPARHKRLQCHFGRGCAWDCILVRGDWSNGPRFRSPFNTHNCILHSLRTTEKFGLLFTRFSLSSEIRHLPTPHNSTT